MTNSLDRVASTVADGDLQALMASYQNGEISSFDTLYRHLQPALRRYLVSLTLDVPHAEDLVQETFLQIHRSRHSYVPPRPVQPWAFGIARNVYLMDRRAGSRRRRHEAETEEVLTEIPTAALQEGAANRDLLRRAITRLAPDSREPLLLHHVWGFSFREIGGMLGIREGTAKVRVHRAMKSLRSLLGRSPVILGRSVRYASGGIPTPRWQ